MKVLFIGGTGLISSACSALAVQDGIELTLLNRSLSTRYAPPEGAEVIVADIHKDAASALGGRQFDAVVDWIAYTPEDIERDVALFNGHTRQYVFISSASAYQTPPANYLITEGTPLQNPYWEYSRNKIACEERLLKAYREEGFPGVIVRPSHTYGPSQIALSYCSWMHPWTSIDRMRRGKPLIVPGDGTSLWVLTHNTDFAKGFNPLLGREDTIGHAFHITSDEALTWDAIHRQAAEAAGVEPNLVHIPSELIAAYDPDSGPGLLGDKSNSVVFDNSKIKKFVPQYVATKRWSEGIRESIAWFEADPSRQTVDHEAEARWDRILAAYESAWPSGR